MVLRNLMDQDILFQLNQFPQQACQGTRARQHIKGEAIQSQHPDRHIILLIIQIQQMTPMQVLVKAQMEVAIFTRFHRALLNNCNTKVHRSCILF